MALEALGFSKFENDWGHYGLRNSDGTPVMLLFAYVDDLVLAAGSTEDTDHVLSGLNTKRRIATLGQAKHVLGLIIDRDRSSKTVNLSQAACIEKLVERFLGFLAPCCKAGGSPRYRRQGRRTGCPNQAVSGSGWLPHMGCRVHKTRHRIRLVLPRLPHHITHSR
jgi:hypothetical protein